MHLCIINLTLVANQKNNRCLSRYLIRMATHPTVSINCLPSASVLLLTPDSQRLPRFTFSGSKRASAEANVITANTNCQPHHLPLSVSTDGIKKESCKLLQLSVDNEKEPLDWLICLTFAPDLLIPLSEKRIPKGFLSGRMSTSRFIIKIRLRGSLLSIGLLGGDIFKWCHQIAADKNRNFGPEG